ncbi:phosphatidate cytidylyltransferase [Acidiferrobacter sp.]|jgi:phosphatidate cytidylyltransferase|uniref:phosphatidate cytidylyltransferase n=1 Tax=Acidiferrobacter sp. TaxID=1872107 RepID=UPI0026205744|nr:phosphatidate cytidylyltransferase [Acidiferrobacter sp.]
MHLFPQTPHFAIMAWLFAGLVLLLTLASGVGYALNRRHGAQRSAVVDNLNARIRAWWWMVGILGLAFAFGQDVTLALFAVASFFSLREFISLTPTRPGDHAALVAAFYVMLPAQYLLIASHWYGLFVILIPVYGFLLLPLLSAIGKDTQSFLERAAKIQWAVMITVYCLSYAPALLMLKIPSDPGGDALLLFFLIFVVQVSDVLQYVFGKMFGKTLIAPTLSPSKTVEGFIGGALSATVLGTCLWWATPFRPWQAGLIAGIIVVMGFCGGLVLSAVKRSLGAKDWGSMIEGHGGALDRLDSVVFSAPVFFHLVRFFWT